MTFNVHVHAQSRDKQSSISINITLITLDQWRRYALDIHIINNQYSIV